MPPPQVPQIGTMNQQRPMIIGQNQNLNQQQRLTNLQLTNQPVNNIKLVIFL